MAEIDYTDPCAALAFLQAEYTKLLAGQKVLISEFESGANVRRKLQFAQVNARFIQEEIARLTSACQRARGLSARRCIRGG